jgi:hypothetical protein
VGETGDTETEKVRVRDKRKYRGNANTEKIVRARFKRAVYIIYSGTSEDRELEQGLDMPYISYTVVLLKIES